MHGAGNDYIYINSSVYHIENPEMFTMKWSSSHTGIGSDGLVLIGKSDVADFSMRIFNADGSEAMMCGNASRCIGKYVYDKGLTDKKEITLDTLSGIKRLFLHPEENLVTKVTVDMGEPKVESKDIGIDNISYRGSVISMGNPHFVIFVDDINTVNLAEIGPVIENHPSFPDRTNVEFAQVAGDNKIRMRVWERGSGITQACGTGACATAVAAISTGRSGREVEIVMDGGSLTIQWERNNHIYMTGEAIKVFEGEIEI